MGAKKMYEMVERHLNFVGSKLEEAAEGNEMNIKHKATVPAIAEEDESDVLLHQPHEHEQEENKKEA